MRQPSEIKIGDTTLAEVLRLHGLWRAGDPAGKRADLREAYLRWAWLRGADLRGADLREAYLRGANLRGANLRRADLRGANLSDADLSEADLREANLRGADLREADLRGANLREANLRGADLSEAYLRGAVGNKHEIKSAHFDTWDMAWTMSPDGAAWLQIGCERYPVEDWRAFDDERIAKMDEDALPWWRKNRELVLKLVDDSPAVAWGRPA